ncbi:hypothetical protein NC652_028318 [Populus alba x Populus x berolinensis]|uniref:Uncharacterized protein n=1 Tax=Populus alba x Populus x berolinensis TaxID=444605 RepID=A0AAD6M7N8_9ROSI|nr:hypothetical protein NC652_028311 [Populus alba x Populus x berolinensis]KAJ6894514.1 hypothetical protein NC652_028318 [Populus alba x Populus x berolinensis]KAJ6980157.1 hypothetical protein NC653_028086 [Populus alba x Populus x berolinensis]KAJ6980166.1 hypothetical protein NC653_028094 [Populus alba x Populus x berolinensis]
MSPRKVMALSAQNCKSLLIEAAWMIISKGC